MDIKLYKCDSWEIKIPEFYNLSVIINYEKDSNEYLHIVVKINKTNIKTLYIVKL